MGFSWMNIVPSDHYIIRAVRMIHPVELSHITHLYQPLIGPFPVSLYITLYNELPCSAVEPQTGTHRWLMSVMCSPLDQIVKARESLEAVGLLRTVKIEKGQGTCVYEYSIQPPLPPASFFGDDMMSIILLNKIGKTKYEQLRKKLLGLQGIADKIQGERKDITKGFDEVFRSFSPSELFVEIGSETELFLEEMEARYPAKNRLLRSSEQKSGPKFHRVEPDFDFLEASLPKTMGENRRLSQEIRQVIQELAFFYQLDDMQLSYFLQDPYIYDDGNEIRPILLRQLVRNWYTKQNKGRTPVINPAESLRPSIAEETKEETKEESKEDEHKRALLNLSPISLLEHYQNGGKVSPADLKIVEELVSDYSLPYGVINVLLEYVMLTNNKQLPRSLIFKIATHWKRLGIETVEEALVQAKQLYQEMRTRNKQKSNPPMDQGPASHRKKKTSYAKNDLPEWVEKQLKGSPSETDHQEVDEDKKQEALRLLKALGEIQ